MCYIKRITLSCLMIFGIIILFSFKLQTNSFLNWKSDRKLKWDDFKGIQPDNIYGSYHCYFNIADFEEKEKDSVIIKTNAAFLLNKSWVRKDLVDDEQLWSVQIDFDIFELYARKLTQVYSKMTFTKKEILDGKLEEVRDSISTLAGKNCKLIDEDFSYNDSEEKKKALQQKWDLKVKNELDAMEAY